MLLGNLKIVIKQLSQKRRSKSLKRIFLSKLLSTGRPSKSILACKRIDFLKNMKLLKKMEDLRRIRQSNKLLLLSDL